MALKTNYLRIHEDAYKRLKKEGKTSWTDYEDLRDRALFLRDVLQKYKILPEAKVLVLGCGDGETLLWFGQLGHPVTGIDISPTAIDWAKEKSQQRKVNSQLILGDLTSPALALGNYDVVADDHLLHCIIGDDRKVLLEKVYSALNPNGFFIMRTQCGDLPEDTPEEVRKMWDYETRCLFYKDVAGRYYGRPEDLIQEFKDAQFEVLQHGVVQTVDGTEMLEAVLQKK